MIIDAQKCVGCGRCQPYCPAGAIGFTELVSIIDQGKCYECGTCLRLEVCPVGAIGESPAAMEYPRAVRKYFSDPTATHVTTKIEGRGTEESKTNDVTGRCGPDEVGVAIEVGRPLLGMDFEDIQRITRALARAGITEIEPRNPVQLLVADPATGDVKPEVLGERVLSAIIEIQVQRSRLPLVLQTVKQVASEVDSVFCLDVYFQLDPGLQIPAEIETAILESGLRWRPNAKINLGLGRATARPQEGSK